MVVKSSPAIWLSSDEGSGSWLSTATMVSPDSALPPLSQPLSAHPLYPELVKLLRAAPGMPPNATSLPSVLDVGCGRQPLSFSCSIYPRQLVDVLIFGFNSGQRSSTSRRNGQPFLSTVLWSRLGGSRTATCPDDLSFACLASSVHTLCCLATIMLSSNLSPSPSLPHPAPPRSLS